MMRDMDTTKPAPGTRIPDHTVPHNQPPPTKPGLGEAAEPKPVAPTPAQKPDTTAPGRLDRGDSNPGTSVRRDG